MIQSPKMIKIIFTGYFIFLYGITYKYNYKKIDSKEELILSQIIIQ